MVLKRGFDVGQVREIFGQTRFLDDATEDGVVTAAVRETAQETLAHAALRPNKQIGLGERTGTGDLDDALAQGALLGREFNRFGLRHALLAGLPFVALRIDLISLRFGESVVLLALDFDYFIDDPGIVL